MDNEIFYTLILFTTITRESINVDMNLRIKESKENLLESLNPLWNLNGDIIKRDSTLN